MDLKPLLREHFGYSDFRPGQQEAIRSVLAQQDTLVVMPTGSGKSLIYQLAALVLPGTTLVISPLIALMKDQVDQLQARHIPATFINSSLTLAQQQERLQQLLARAYRLLYVAPERLRHRAFLETISQVKIGLLAVDEAHCIAQWGHDFRPDYLQIATAAHESLGRPTTLALTATATPQVQDEIISQLGLRAAKRIVTGFNRPNLTFEVRYTPDLDSKHRALGGFLRTTGGAGIVYVGTRRQAEEVAGFIRRELEIEVRPYHAGMDNIMRHKIQEAFMSGAVPVVVATNAFGMGVDRADLRFVLHYSIPGSLESYYQEAGRAGRDGLSAHCVLLYSPEDRRLQEWFIENDAPNAEELFGLYETVRSMAQNGSAWTTLEDLCCVTGIHETKIRVGLAQLETIGALHQLGNEGVRLHLEVGALNLKALETISTEVEARRAHKRRQLQKMVIYAETNSCRRRIILDHFGDPDQIQVPACCDNCQARLSIASASDARPAETTAERVALLILWTVQEIRQKLHSAVGQTKLAQILAGSRSREIVRFRYDTLRAYGRLAQLRRKEISELITQLVAMGYLKSVGSEYPILRLTPAGEEALRTKAAIPLQLPYEVRPDDGRLRAEREAGGTVALTGQLFAQGLSPGQIAVQRGLTEDTIYDHLAQLIAEGKLEIGVVVPSEVRCQIEAAIEAVGSAEKLAPIKAQLPVGISYGVIRCVAAAWERERQSSPHGRSASYSHERIERVVMLGESRDPQCVAELLAALEDSDGNMRRLAASALGKIRDQRAVQPLLELLKREQKPQVRQYAITALGELGDPQAYSIIEQIAHDLNEKGYNRRAAVRALKKLRMTHTACS